MAPSEMFKALRLKGYSEESASFITGQYFQNPDDRRKWGTEEQTRKDIEEIVRAFKVKRAS